MWFGVKFKRILCLLIAGALVPAVLYGCGSTGAEQTMGDTADTAPGQGDGEALYADSGTADGGESAAEALFLNLAEGAVTVASSTDGAHDSGLAVDGDPETWWRGENVSDQIILDLGEERTFSCLRILWDNINIAGWTLEASRDGQDYTTLSSMDPPYLKDQEIDLTDAGGQSVQARFLRFTVNRGKGDIGSDGVPGIREIQIYETDPWEEIFDNLSVSVDDTGRSDGSKTLLLSGVPDGIDAAFGGCDYEQVIDSEGAVRTPLEEKTVHVGYELTYKDWTVMTPDYEVRVQGDDKSSRENAGEAEDTGEAQNAGEVENAKPAVVPAIQEWAGGAGYLALDPETEEAIINAETAGMLSVRTDEENVEGVLPVRPRTETADDSESSIEDGRERSADDAGSGTEESFEEYEITIDETGILISAGGSTGKLWAFRTLQQMVKQADRDADGNVLLPEGTIRDYPQYPVRGFEIDAARFYVPMDLLYRIADTMSQYKMNELTVHLSDNEIIGGSDDELTEEDIFTEKYAAYRMESSIGTDSRSETEAEDTGEHTAGEEVTDNSEVQSASGNTEAEESAASGSGSITAEDGSYTRAEFAAFVSYAASIGVKIIPEIDTPAHALAFTRVFPELAEHYSPEAVQYLDVSKEETVSLVKSIWEEQLETAFAECDVLHLGGDEYYGDAVDYIGYENALIEWAEENGRTPRIWGSVSRVLQNNPGAERLRDDGVQMVVWSGVWVHDPSELLRAGFSVINADSTYTYIVPNGTGSGADYLDKEAFEQQYHVNTFTAAGDGTGEDPDSQEANVVPSWSSQLLGGQFTLWNDYARALGLTEEDLYERFADAVPCVCRKFWQDAGS